jgi:hypothetical protein
MTTPNKEILDVFRRKDLLASEKIVFLTLQLAGDMTQKELTKRTRLNRNTVQRAVKVLKIREAQLAMAAVAGGE